jgi:transposase
VSGLEGMSREELLALVLAQARTIEVLTERVAELGRQLASDSSNSSRPPSSDAPWDMKPARKRSSRTRSGRKLGKHCDVRSHVVSEYVVGGSV